jgi:glycosidase
MKYFGISVFLFVGLIFFTVSCGKKTGQTSDVITLPQVYTDVEMAPKVPEWLNNAVIYSINSWTFCDADGDGSGDLKGIESKLDYLAQLHVNAVYLNPFYAVSKSENANFIDYNHVEPKLGTDTIAKELFMAARMKGIRFILDFQINQAHLGNHFISSIDDLFKAKESLLAFFLNWTKMGVSGFRVDFKGLTIEKKQQLQFKKFWTEIQDKIGDQKCYNVVFFSENIDEKFILENGFNVAVTRNVYDTDLFGGLATSYFAKEGKGNASKFMSLFSKQTASAYGAGFLTFWPDKKYESYNQSELSLKKVMLAFQLTMPGIPTLQSGEEIGCVTEKNIINKNPVNQQDKDSMSHFASALVQLKRTQSALASYARFFPLTAVPSTSYPIAYLRVCDKDVVLVIINPSGKEAKAQFRADLPVEKLKMLSGTKASFNQQNNVLTVSIPSTSYYIGSFN